MELFWLTYMNDTLFAQGVITEVKHSKMRVKIIPPTASAERKNFRAAGKCACLPCT